MRWLALILALIVAKNGADIELTSYRRENVYVLSDMRSELVRVQTHAHRIRRKHKPTPILRSSRTVVRWEFKKTI